jgi:hypothetical protein
MPHKGMEVFVSKQDDIPGDSKIYRVESALRSHNLTQHIRHVDVQFHQVAIKF